MPSREDELWRLIKFDKDATPGQVTAWCRELIAILEKWDGALLWLKRSRRPTLEEALWELDLSQRHIDIAGDIIRLLITKGEE